MTKPNNSKLWQVGITVLTAISITSVGWAFTVLRDMPTVYTTKIELRQQRQDICDRLNRIEATQIRIENKLDNYILKKQGAAISN